MRSYSHLYSILIFLAVVPCVLVFRHLALAPALIFICALPFLASSVWRNELGEMLKSYKIPSLTLSIITGILILSLVNVAWSEYPDMSWMRLQKILPLFILGGGFIALTHLVKAESFAKYVFFATVISMLFFIEENLFNSPLYRLMRGISEGESFNPSELNRAASVITMLFAITITQSYQRPQKLLLLTLFVVVCALTESQTVQLAAMAILGSILCFTIFKDKAAYIILVVLIALAASAPWFFPYIFDHRPVSLGGYMDINASAYMRLEVWDGFARRAQDTLFLGHGANVSQMLPLPINSIYYPTPRALHPHNFLLEIWTEFGAVGAAFLIGCLVCIAIKVKSLTLPQQNSAYALLVSIFAIFLTGFGMWQGWLLGSVLLMIGIFQQFLKLENET